MALFCAIPTLKRGANNLCSCGAWGGGARVAIERLDSPQGARAMAIDVPKKARELSKPRAFSGFG
jgi:hypothetical protein